MTLPVRLRLEQLASLSSEDRQVFSDAITRTVSLERHQDLISQGDRPEECFLILEGLLCRYKVLPNGRRQILGFHIAGDFCDINGLVMGQADHSVASLTKAKIAAIGRAALLNIMDRRPDIGRALWKETIADAAIAREWVVNVGQRSAYGRIAHLLCEMGRRLEAAGLSASGNFEFPVTQAELADATGMSTVHVNRVYQQLRRDGLVVIKGSHVEVRDWRRLEKEAQFDPDYLFLPYDGAVEQAPA